MHPLLRKFPSTHSTSGLRRSGRLREARSLTVLCALFFVAMSLIAAGAGPRPVPSAAALAPDLPSTPLDAKLPAAATGIVQTTVTRTPRSLSSGLVVTGLNMTISQRTVDSNSIPPDTMGAVGPDHIVEMINGNFQIFRKSDGMSLDSRSLGSFWANIAGVAIPVFNDICSGPGGTCSQSGDSCDTTSDCRQNSTFDPRVLFDEASGRWFAVSLDRSNPATGDNNVLVARSDTDDPTGDWDGLLFDADTVAPPEFHDYETLAVDADGFFSCTQDFDSGSGGGGVESCYSIPKADLLMAAPTAANISRFENSPANLPSVSGSIQPVVDFGPSDGRSALYGVDGGSLVRSDILGAGAAGATLGAISSITGDPGHSSPPDARQPHPSGRTIENVAPRFVSYVMEQGDRIWAVHAVAGNFSNSALRWYEISEVTDTVIQTGVIEDPDVDFHEPSIAVNQFGNVVIGYTCSGPNRAPGSCVSLGETINGVTTFDPPVLLQAGAGHYFRDFPAGRNRWGDYSATVKDPAGSCTFWTFQEFVAVSAVGDVDEDNNGGQWGIQLTELSIAPPVITIPGDVDVGLTCTGSTRTATLNVCNTTPNSGSCANLVVSGITSSDNDFAVTTPSSGFPVTISPDFCFPFQVTFTPDGPGPDSSTLTVASNDPLQPEVEVQVTGVGGEPDVRVTGSTTFGDVCAGTLAEQTVSVCNVGHCDLDVISVAFDPPCPDFTLVNNPFPAVVSPDSCQDVVVRFTPTSAGPKACTLEITTDDPGTPVITRTVTANTPLPSIDVPPDQAFPPTVIQSVGDCTTANPFPVSNTGICDLRITSIAVTDNAAEFSQSGLPSFPIILEPGHIAGEGDLNNVFAPGVLDRDRTGQVTVSYVSEPITGAVTDVTRALCGEGVRTGARVLVQAGGVPLASVEQIKLQRINANRNKNLLDTVDNARDLALQTVIPAPPCGPFQYHREYATVSNPIQLLPGSYQVTVTAIVNGKRTRRSVGFDVNTCGYNPTIIVNF